MSKILENLLYTESHEWVKLEDGKAKIGITDHAQESLGDIVFLNLPEDGDPVTAGESFCDVESVKAVSDIYSPVTGTICAVNDALADSPELLNEDPYAAWICEIKDITDKESFLSPAEYEAFLQKED
ncbi:glycine cleavage system protein GcvH [Yeguia hominis]|uniref:Glycine cleavage system H protein n=1 Tax=Yeguia hominis TaxID=2763662 RepID=A0A926D988_9FIRM|nr:glycine cleavage system protein GcvH [Yeguia hominis]MBC8532725.1 glycine cleavage system protein GcvH [Yeguia hominis]